MPTFIISVIRVNAPAAKAIQQIFSLEKYLFNMLYTFSFTFLPSNPAGLMIKIKIRMT